MQPIFFRHIRDNISKTQIKQHISSRIKAGSSLMWVLYLSSINNILVQEILQLKTLKGDWTVCKVPFPYVYEQ